LRLKEVEEKLKNTVKKEKVLEKNIQNEENIQEDQNKYFKILVDFYLLLFLECFVLFTFRRDARRRLVDARLCLRPAACGTSIFTGIFIVILLGSIRQDSSILGTLRSMNVRGKFLSFCWVIFIFCTASRQLAAIEVFRMNPIPVVGRGNGPVFTG
jgi:hypothetical protein